MKTATKNRFKSIKECNFLTGWLLCGAMVFSVFLTVSAEPTVYENGSSYEIVDGVLKITVPEGKTNDVASTELSPLLDNTVKSVEKYGRGSIVMNMDLTAYTGDIHIKEGTWRVVDSKGLGKLSGTSKADNVGKVYVSDGATLEAKCAEVPKYQGKQIHVSGYGVDGNGALLVSGDIESYGGATWGSNLILEGDTYANSITKRKHIGITIKPIIPTEDGSLSTDTISLFQEERGIIHLLFSPELTIPTWDGSS